MPQLKLSKIPLFGEELDESEYDFEWPKESDLDLLGSSDQVFLKSLYFMSSTEEYQPISRVTCIFENGIKSPNIFTKQAR